MNNMTSSTNQMELDILGLGDKKPSIHSVEFSKHKLTFDIYNDYIPFAEARRMFLLVSGEFFTRESIRPLAVRLAYENPNALILVVDLPWHGASESTIPVEGKTLHDYHIIMRTFVELLRKDFLYTGRLSWVGFGIGGSLGLLADLDKLGIDDLVLISSYARGLEFEPVTDMLNHNTNWEEVRLKETIENSIREDNDLEDAKAVIDNLPSFLADYEVAKNDMNALDMSKFNILSSLENITAKTLIINGEKVSNLAKEEQQLMGENIDKCIRYEYNGNWMAIFREDTLDEMVDVITEVLDYM